MSNINGIGPTQNINPAQPTRPAAKTTAPAQDRATQTDRVELSNVNALLTKLKSNDVRTDMVAQIKSQIDAGTYETDDKIDGAIDKLMDDLA